MPALRQPRPVGLVSFDEAEDGILPDDLKVVFQNNPVYSEKYQQLSAAKQKQLLMALALKKGGRRG